MEARVRLGQAPNNYLARACKSDVVLSLTFFGIAMKSLAPSTSRLASATSWCRVSLVQSRSIQGGCVVELTWPLGFGQDFPGNSRCILLDAALGVFQESRL